MPYLFHEMNNLLGKKSENKVNTNESGTNRNTPGMVTMICELKYKWIKSIFAAAC